MILRAGSYVTENTDLLVKVVKVHHQNDTHAKIKAELYNASNGIHYETKNYKVYKSFITHWVRK